MSQYQINKMINDYVLSGIILGTYAGITPGPLLTVVITQTIRCGLLEGIKVAVAPLITDIPLICIILFLLEKISDTNHLLAIVSFVGAGLIFTMAIKNILFKPYELKITNENTFSYTKGILVNALNPYPYIFWFTVGVPIIIKASNESLVMPFLFILPFFIFMIGFKIVIAIVVDRSRDFFSSLFYMWVIRASGICLLFFSYFLFRDSLRYISSV